MQCRRLVALLGMLPVLGCGFWATDARAATPDFTISATNVNLPVSGIGIGHFTLTSVNGFAGTIGVRCRYAGPTTEAKLPSCPMTPPVAYTLVANGTLNGVIGFYPYGAPIPASLPVPRSVPQSAIGLALAGAFLLGAGLGRRNGRRRVLMLCAFGVLAGLAGISACGGTSNAMTSGSYPYTVTATDTTDSSASVSTTISVTVP